MTDASSLRARRLLLIATTLAAAAIVQAHGGSEEPPSVFTTNNTVTGLAAQETDPGTNATTAGQAYARFDEWLGRRVSVPVEIPPPPPVAVLPLRVRDRLFDRLQIAGIAREYFPAESSAAAAPDRWFFEGLRHYVAVRAIHEMLAGNHFADQRYFGGFVPYVVRSVALSRSPDFGAAPVRWFPELSGLPSDSPTALATYAASPEARMVDAMFTLERTIGWPTLQTALAELNATPSPPTVADFISTLERASGRELKPFFNHVLRVTEVFDYAVVELTSRAAGTPDMFETSLQIGRMGAAVFPVEIEVAFADGVSRRESWDGKAETTMFRYTSTSPAVRAHVDPDKLLVLDRDRSNNVKLGQRSLHAPAVRWTFYWLAWLEDAMLACTALI